MTNPDRCREEFEKWVSPKWSRDRTENGLYASIELAMAYRVWQAATQATARRCVEIGDETLAEISKIHKSDDTRCAILTYRDVIADEFGLQGE